MEAGQANHKVLMECPTLVTGASAILTMGIPMPPSDSSLGTAIPLNPSSTVGARACRGEWGAWAGHQHPDRDQEQASDREQPCPWCELHGDGHLRHEGAECN